MATTFNMFDLIFAIASFIFILVAFFRGFVKELFALFNWIITISLTYLLTPYVTKFAEHYSHNKLVVNVASGSIVFVIIFIIVALATRGLSHDWKEKMPENLDRVLGVLYGVFKSLLIFGLIYAVIVNFYSTLLGGAKKAEETPKVHHDLTKGHESAKHHEVEIAHEASKHAKKEKRNVPDWLLQAKCFPIIQFSGELIDPLVSKAIDSMSKNLIDDIDIKPTQKNLDEKIDEVIDDGEKGVGNEVGGSGGALSEKKSGEKYDDTGYSKKEIEKMNRLIEIVN